MMSSDLLGLTFLAVRSRKRAEKSTKKCNKNKADTHQSGRRDLSGIMESAEKNLEDIFLQIRGADELRHRRLCYFSFIMSKALKQRTSGYK